MATDHVIPHSLARIAKLTMGKQRNLPRAARSDFAEFVAEVGTDHTGKTMVLDTYARVTIAVLRGAFEEGRHYSQVSPPGLGKSTYARLFMLWRIGRCQTLRTAVIGGSLDGSEDNVSLCRQILLSDEYKRVFPEAKPDYERSMSASAKESDKRAGRGWRQDSWFLQAVGQRKDPTMASVAAVPKREDMRVDILLADDIVTEKIANSTAERVAIERAFWATWIEGRLSNGGQCIYLQNLRRQGDLAHKLRDDKRFVSMWVGVTRDFERMFVRLWNASPAIVAAVAEAGGAELEPVDPAGGAGVEFHFPLPARDSFAPDALRAKHAQTMRQLYFLEPGNPEDALLPQFDAFRKAGRFAPGHPGAAFQLVPAGTSGIFMPADKSWEHAGLDVLGGLDWSGKNRRGKALTLVARQRATGKITPIYHQRIKGTLSDVVALFGKLWQVGVRWQFMLLEDNGVQVELNEVIRAGAPAQWRHTIKDFKTLPGAKLDPVRGLSVIGTMLETGGFLWPAGAASVSGDWAMLEAELTDTTIEQVSTPGKTPDGLMSLWFPMHHLTQTPAAASKEPLRPVPASPSAGRHGGY